MMCDCVLATHAVNASLVLGSGSCEQFASYMLICFLFVIDVYYSSFKIEISCWLTNKQNP